ncbi:transcriptional regulator HxlR family [Alistipes sp. CAG:268]|mgnify:CR=1 FL=1|jgi:DNA-binding HxlR family transcriptional regulator|nr:transcriptional regulator HxlR family [Alistipes sp. CAG:268]
MYLCGQSDVFYTVSQTLFQVNRIRPWIKNERMKRSILEDATFPACPVRNVLARLCDKWTLLALYLLLRSEHGKLRFTELKQAMPDISQKMLVTTLRTLEEDGYVERRLFAEVPPRVEYALTAQTETLRPILDELLSWAMENMDAIMESRQKAFAAKDSGVENTKKKNI